MALSNWLLISWIPTRKVTWWSSSMISPVGRWEEYLFREETKRTIRDSDLVAVRWHFSSSHHEIFHGCEFVDHLNGLLHLRRRTWYTYSKRFSMRRFLDSFCLWRSKHEERKKKSEYWDDSFLVSSLRASFQAFSLLLSLPPVPSLPFPSLLPASPLFSLLPLHHS